MFESLPHFVYARSERPTVPPLASGDGRGQCG